MSKIVGNAVNGLMGEDEVLRQSMGAFSQWQSLWEENCRSNKPYLTRSFTKDLTDFGKGKSVIAVAYGNSLQKNIDQIKQLYNNGTDVACCDKAFHYLIKHGILPRFCILQDAQVNWEKYGEDCETSETTLIANVCANHAWIKNWKGAIYFTVNKDNLHSEIKFSQLTGCKDMIPAASNVGNALVVILSSLFMNYSNIMLVGFDYSWKKESAYYGGEDTDKRFHLNHIKVLDINNDLVSTSTNLDFSARWLQSFIGRFKTPVINCSGQGILYQLKTGELKDFIKVGI